MSRFPYFNIPFPYYRAQYRYPNYNSYSNYTKNSSSNDELTSSENAIYPENSTNNRFYTKKNKSNSNNSNYLFDLFGLKIYFDDVLIVSLLFFLYTEGVKDDMLFIVLLLLLIS